MLYMKFLTLAIKVKCISSIFHPDFVSTENSSDDILYEFYELEIYRKI